MLTKLTNRFRWIHAALCGMLFLNASPVSAQNPAVTLLVDAARDRRPIDPRIYGVNHATTAQLADLNVFLNRNGGNHTSRYNWKLNADNRGQDWYFQSIAEPSPTPGERGDTFITRSRAGGADAMLTIPMVGWVAKLGPNRGKLASFSIKKYGAQTGNDAQWFPDAGNGILKSTGQPVTGNDPHDANVPADSTFMQEWVHHLVGKWGRAAEGGLKYYILDNEPSIWHSTHRDVHPEGAKMEEVRDKILDTAAKIKAVDPTAVVAGPEEWGWSGYLFSGYDQQWGSRYGWSHLPDRAAHGGKEYLPWLLSELKKHHDATGTRLLDLFTVHYYPQGGEFSNDTSELMQRRRNRSTRSLWDLRYTDESWIGTQVKLIPRLKGWVNAHYPGTPVGLTEYNWGATHHINGATAQADLLGIFGREGLDLATLWDLPAASTPTYKAIKMYRNYDGRKSTFGDVSVAASGSNPDTLSAFAATRRTDGALTLMVIHKALAGSTPLPVNLSNYNAAATAQAWRLTSANAIQQLPDVSVSSSGFSATLPPQSITLFVLPAASATGEVNGDGNLDIADAVLLLQFVVGHQSPNPAQLQAADLNRNGRADVEDAVLVLKRILAVE
ncbi:MAG: cellulase [Armatimonadetes bacterium]|nr:cellulase [Armatimonadota bacterium]